MNIPVSGQHVQVSSCLIFPESLTPLPPFLKVTVGSCGANEGGIGGVIPARTLVSRCLKSELFIFAKNVNAERIPLFPDGCVELPSLLFLRGAVGRGATKEAGLQTPVVLRAVNTSLFTAGMELTLIPAARGHNKLDGASARLHNKNPPPHFNDYCSNILLLYLNAARLKPNSDSSGWFFGLTWQIECVSGSGGWRK